MEAKEEEELLVTHPQVEGMMIFVKKIYLSSVSLMSVPAQLPVARTSKEVWRNEKVKILIFGLNSHLGVIPEPDYPSSRVGGGRSAVSTTRTRHFATSSHPVVTISANALQWKPIMSLTC